MSTINPVFTKFYRDKIDGILSDRLNLGTGAGSIDQGADAVAIGTDAGHTNQGADAIAIGQNAAYEGQGNYGVSIGQASGAVNQGTEAISIGHGAAADTQGAQSVAIGKSAGYEDQQAKSIAIGFEAGMTDQATQAIAIGTETAKTNQATNAIAIGTSAGSANQEVGCISIGYGSGNNAQKSKSVSIGYNSGRTSQLADGVAIGNSAAYEYQQGSAVAIGPSAGYSTQGEFAIAIGKGAGQTSQGQNSIAIGKQAGETSQHANSIVLNASGSALNTDGTSRCFISPVRTAASSSDIHPLQYNTTTKEVSYATNGIPVFVGEGAQLTTAALEVTGIPTWCKNVQVIFRNIVWSNANIPALFLGYGSGPTYNNTTYNGLITSIDSDGQVNRAGTGTGVNLQQTSLTTNAYSGIFNLSRAGVYSTFEQWIWSFQSFNKKGITDYFINGAGTFTAPNTEIINSVKINTTAGTFTAGSMLVYAW